MIKKISRIFFILLLGGLVFISLPQRAVMAQADDETLIRQTINSYFDLKYQARATLSPSAFGQFVASGARAQRFLKAEMDRREIDYHRASLFGFKYVDYSYTLDIQSVEIHQDNNSATVVLIEGHDVVFEATSPTVSKMRDLEHTIELVKENGDWKLLEDNYVDSLVALMNGTGLTKAQLIQLNIQQHQDFVSQQKQQSSSRSSGHRQRSSSNLGQGLSMLGGYYNNWAAANYAHTHYSGSGGYPTYPNFNDPVWRTLPGFENASDCANFVSQAMHVGGGNGGGIPFANYLGGTAGWYIRTSPLAKSQSWAWAQGLSDFIVSTTEQNTWTAGAPDGYVGGSGVAGDVVSYENGTSADYWDHVAMVVGNNGAYALIADRSYPSNNHDNYPIYQIYHTNMQIIHVTGY